MICPFALFLVGLFLTWVLCFFLGYPSGHTILIITVPIFNPFCGDECYIVSFLAMINDHPSSYSYLPLLFLSYQVIAAAVTL